MYKIITSAWILYFEVSTEGCGSVLYDLRTSFLTKDLLTR